MLEITFGESRPATDLSPLSYGAPKKNPSGKNWNGGYVAVWLLPEQKFSLFKHG